MFGKTLRTLNVVSFLIPGALSLVACSSDSAGDKYGSADSFCDAKSDEECQAAAAVCSATIDSCKTRRRAACLDAAGAATAQGRQYRAQAAEKCIDQTKTLYETKVVDLDKEAAVNDVCEHVFTGSKKKNEACAEKYECEGNLICDRGACAEVVKKKLDDPCNNPGETCAKGSYCGPRGDTNFCIARNGLDDICSDDTPCMEDLRCVTTCKDKLDPGNSCDKSEDCKTGYCGTDKKCAAKLVPGTGNCSDFGG